MSTHHFSLQAASAFWRARVRRVDQLVVVLLRCSMADAVVAPLARSPSPVDEEENNDDDGLTSQERLARQRLEYEEGDSPALEVVKEERIAQIELANFGVPEGGKVWHARLPNFLSLESGPFDELLWEPMDPIEGLDGDEGGDGGGDGGKKRAPVPDENVIRWRWTKDQLGQVVRHLSLLSSLLPRSS